MNACWNDDPNQSLGKICNTERVMPGLLRLASSLLRPVVLVALLFIAAVASAAGQDVIRPAPPGVPADQFPPPNRPVAEIVSPTRTSDEERDAIDEAGQLARLMGIRPGMTVADIGAGEGYHAIRLAPLVGPSGRIIAQDVKPEYLADLAARIQRLGLRNVSLVLGEPHDPRLASDTLDAAILVHMYHEIAQPFAFLHNLAPALKPGARLGIVDFDRPTWEHGTPPALLRCELAAAGYRELALHTLSGGAGYLAIFAPPPSETRKRPFEVRPCEVKQQ